MTDQWFVGRALFNAFAIVSTSLAAIPLAAQSEDNTVAVISDTLHSDKLVTTRDQDHRPHAEAVVMQPVQIDGDLSEWPSDLPRYALLVNGQAYGPTDIDSDDLATSTDLSAVFMIGWSPKEQLLYVGLRVYDDLHVADGSDPWSNDACELYLAPDAEAMMFPGDPRVATAAELPVQQYIAVAGTGAYEEDSANPSLGRGDIATTGSHAAWQRRGNITTYEWALQVLALLPDQPLPLNAGTRLGFDVVIVDKDEEGPPSWIHWGPQGARKYANPGILGTVQLLPAD